MISIRESIPEDNERLTEIWLNASVKAHDFIPKDFWTDKVENMKRLYLPNSYTIVAYDNENVLITGFISIVGNHHIAALFIDVPYQNQSTGSLLLQYVSDRFSNLTLSVYIENTKAVSFYLRHGFFILQERIDKNTGHSEYLMQKII